MGGVAGWVDWERDLTRSPDVITAMTDALAHRGPDGGGTWTERHVALAQRDAPPPVVPADGGDVVVAYDGELTNRRRLREELRRAGRRLRTGGDAELVAQAYLCWGALCVERLEGAFAFAVWDGRRRELVLVRDRLGVRPLYFWSYGSGIVFGSEPKALLAHPLFEPELDSEGVAELFGLWPYHTPGHGLLRGLEELRPGTLRWVRRGGTVPGTYWRLTGRPHEDDAAMTARTVRRLLTDAVADRLGTGTPVCALLSGEVGPAGVTALAARTLAGTGRGPVTAVSVDVTGVEPPAGDAALARLVADHLGANHKEILVDVSELAGPGDAPLRAWDLPVLDEGDALRYLFLREVRGQAPVALSGVGADEVFCGYEWFRAGYPMPAHFPWTPDGSGGASVLNALTLREIRLDEYVADRYAQAVAAVPVPPGETGLARRARQAAYLTLTQHLPVELARLDRLGRAAGLEVRLPFADHRLVEYAWHLPAAVNAWGGLDKGVLRRAVSDLLPWPVISGRPHRYPSAPGYALRAAARALTTDLTSPLRPLLDPEKVNALADRATPDRYAAGGRSALAGLVAIDAWLRAYRVRFR
jgi:asparagine synthase (glutamine-hydrolysing)